MITVTRKLISEENVKERLASLARQYSIQPDCYEESAADQMLDFDSQEWVALCGQLKASQRRNQEKIAKCSIPSTLRSFYDGPKEPFRSEDTEDNSDKLIALAA